MDVLELPLSPTLRTKLQAAGYLTLDGAMSPLQLAQDAEVTPKEALDILKLVRNMSTFGSSSREKIITIGASAWDIWLNEKTRPKMGTSCKELDEILGGGIASKQVTEISGVPGVGKTQLGMQLSINVQIPPELSGVGGHAVYIDTEGSFMVERVIQLAKSCILDMEKKATVDPGLNWDQLNSKFQVEDLLSRIYYFRVHSATEQVAVINRMESFLLEHSQVRLIVMDSVAFQFRQGFSDMGARSRLLSSMAQTLAALAEKHDLAIVVVNQVTQRFSDEGPRMLPALGEVWAHATTNRVILYWNDGQRYAMMLKSPSLPRRVAAYAVTQDGIRSAIEDNLAVRHSVQ